MLCNLCWKNKTVSSYTPTKQSYLFFTHKLLKTRSQKITPESNSKLRAMIIDKYSQGLKHSKEFNKTGTYLQRFDTPIAKRTKDVQEW
jgi:hypothetical protein